MHNNKKTISRRGDSTMSKLSEQFMQQIQFIVEIDKLKTIFRRTKLIHDERYENDAEHTWHLAMMAIIMQPYANEQVDLLKVIKMLLVHDIVEIDAGDTFAYDVAGYADKEEREINAANRIFGILPDKQAEELKQLWFEFEKRETAEAKFANSIDRLQPMIHNYNNKGDTWQRFNITSDMVEAKNAYIKEGSHMLWEYAKHIIEDAVEKGYLNKKA